MRTRRLASSFVLVLTVLVVGAASAAVPAAAAGPAAAAAPALVLLATLVLAASLTVRGASATAPPALGPRWGVR